MEKLIIIVEANFDKEVVQTILPVLGVELVQVKIEVAHSKQRMEKVLIEMRAIQAGIPIAILQDSDEMFVADAREKVRESWQKTHQAHLFFAVPCIEAWLFADDELALAQMHHESHEYILKRLPFPDEIPFPKDLAMRLFANHYNKLNIEFLQNINIERAISRSPSLRDFVLGVTNLLSVPNEHLTNALNPSMDLQIFANLLKEVLPADSILYRTLDGRDVTVAEMEQHIQNGTKLGRDYASDLLRVSRDFLRRKANPRPKNDL